MSYLLGIDVGTSGTKALLIDASKNGAVVASCTKDYPLYTPKPLWAEQDPEDWWQATIAATKELISVSGVEPSDIRGMGLSGQMHGSVFLDADNQVIRPAILWCDQRTHAECEWITRTVGLEKIVELTSNPVLTGFTAGKIIWLRNNEPEAYARVRKVLLPKDYIRFKLTGEYATEVSDASGTSMFNVTKRQWADEMLELIGIPKEWMPKSYESPEVSGRITAKAASLTGLAEGMPVVGGGGDQAAGAVGNGIVRPGAISCSLGTSGVIFAFSDKPTVDAQLRLHTFCHAVPGTWHMMGCVLSAGGGLRWFRDEFADVEVDLAKQLGKDPYEIMCDEAALAPAGSEGLIFLPYLTGERTPYADPHAKGVFFGISLRHKRAHFTRAVMEGASYGLNDSFRTLSENNVPVDQVRISGGGARSPLWKQIMADITGYDQSTINVDEGPALGVALLAGVGTGIWDSVEDACDTVISVVDTVKTDPDSVATYGKFYPIYRSLYQSLKGRFAEVSAAVSE